MYVQGNNDWRSRDQRRRGKTVSISYSECVSVTLVIRHATPMRCIILSVPCLALPHFSTLPYTLHDFRKQIIEHKYILPFSSELLSETFLIPRRTEQDTGSGRNT